MNMQKLILTLTSLSLLLGRDIITIDSNHNAHFGLVKMTEQNIQIIFNYDNTYTDPDDAMVDDNSVYLMSFVIDATEGEEIVLSYNSTATLTKDNLDITISDIQSNQTNDEFVMPDEPIEIKFKGKLNIPGKESVYSGHYTGTFNLDADYKNPE
jgi:hypothetical protein